MVSAWRVAMPFPMCEKRPRKTLPVSFEVTSKAPTNLLMAPLLARTGTVGTLAPLFDGANVAPGNDWFTLCSRQPLLPLQSNLQLPRQCRLQEPRARLDRP